MWISRKYEATLKALFDQFPAVVVTGARQVGKTSLVRRVFPNFAYVTLDIPSIAEQAEKSPDAFINSYDEPLIIDEVQYAPSLFRHLKVKIDENKRAGRFILGRFILTGSQNFLLMQNIAESLAGRCGLLSMLNLSTRELQDSRLKFNENDYIFKGGYPELYDKPEIDPHFWFGSYFSTYLERDVRNILNVGNLRDFDRLLRAVAVRTAQILSYSDLARDVGLLLEPYHRNLGKRLVKSPKLYMCDTGLAAYLMGFENWESIRRHPVVGALWETHIIMQVVKHFASKGKTTPIWFWRTPQGAEVDLLIERGGRFVVVEAKFAETPDNTSLKGINALKKFYGEKNLTSGYIASRTGNSYPLSENVHAVPGSFIDEFIE
jgi:predicted AAA+ superfamily ATPase